MQVARIVAGKQLFQYQGIHCLVLLPQHHQDDDFQPRQRYEVLGQCHGALDDQFARQWIQHAGAFEEGDEAPAVRVEPGGLFGGVAAQRVVVDGDGGQAVAAGLLQSVQPLQGFADFLVLEAGGGELQGELLGFGIGVGVEKVFEEINKYLISDKPQPAG